MAGANSGTRRQKPNILITGTPGTGKSTTASALAEATNFKHICVGDLVKEKNLHDGWDDQFECHVINKDLVCDELEDIMEGGCNIVDYHGCERGYSGTKLSNNIECEIFQVMLEEASDSYKEEAVTAMQSDTIEDISDNVASLTEWIESWSPWVIII
ncbi:hypothetical protein F2Q68_00046238 [Brassica cretica]|uniref:Adenylate kinase n=1 Tax=Brassica cretica TaxID=69181 RepID=A0A8S9LJ76_BRACR|nr:hypothetical protein F2Q68_00046238 [Brassica cretica]